MDKRDLTMMFKILKNMAHNYLTTMFRKCDNSNYSLRSNNLKQSLPKPKTDSLKEASPTVKPLRGIVYPLNFYAR